MDDFITRFDFKSSEEIAALDDVELADYLCDVLELRHRLNIVSGKLIVAGDRFSAVGDWRRVSRALGGCG